MNIDFQEILKELEFRVPNGIINLNEELQVTELVKILRENGVGDAFELAQKARVYFSYVNEAGTTKKASPKKKPAAKPTKTPLKPGESPTYPGYYRIGGKYYSKTPGGEITHTSADGTMEPLSKREKEAANAQKQEPKQLGGAELVGGAEKRKAEKEKPQNKKLKRTEEQTKRQKLNDASLVNIVKNGLIPTQEKKLSGAGVFDPTEEQLTSALDFFQKRIENPDYELDLPRYDISEEEIDKTIEVMRNELGSKEFSRVIGSIQKAGGVDPKLTTGEAGKQRARDIIRLYLSHGGRSAVTGKVVPFNQMQLDHRIPYSNAAKDVKDKKKRGIKTTLLEASIYKELFVVPDCNINFLLYSDLKIVSPNEASVENGLAPPPNDAKLYKPSIDVVDPIE